MSDAFQCRVDLIELHRLIDMLAGIVMDLRVVVNRLQHSLDRLKVCWVHLRYVVGHWCLELRILGRYCLRLVFTLISWLLMVLSHVILNVILGMLICIAVLVAVFSQKLPSILVAMHFSLLATKRASLNFSCPDSVHYFLNVFKEVVMLVLELFINMRQDYIDAHLFFGDERAAFFDVFTYLRQHQLWINL